MNWMMHTRRPWPQARSAIPSADVVFPLPLPVMTTINPLRTFGSKWSILSGSVPRLLMSAIPLSTVLQNVGYLKSADVRELAVLPIYATLPPLLGSWLLLY